MRVLVAATIVGLILSSTAVAQDPSVFISDIFEHKVIVSVGPIERNSDFEFIVPEQTETEVENMARYGCSMFGRYSYPLNVADTAGCFGFSVALTLSEAEKLRLNAQGCMKQYMYACGTHQID